MAFAQTFILASALLLLAACRSQPIQIHTLIPAQPGGFTEAGAVDIQIEAISVPPQVDRQQIVIRQSNSSLAILETQWWSASLMDELRSALTDHLLTDSAGRKVSVRVDVERFDSIPGQHALIDAKWRLRNVGAGDNTLITCRSILKTPTGASIDEIVIAHQNNLKRLARDINRVASGALSGCPASS